MCSVNSAVWNITTLLVMWYVISKLGMGRMIPCLHSVPIAGSNPGGGSDPSFGVFIDPRLHSDPVHGADPATGADRTRALCLHYEISRASYMCMWRESRFTIFRVLNCRIDRQQRLIDAVCVYVHVYIRAVNNACIKSRYNIYFGTQYFE